MLFQFTLYQFSLLYFVRFVRVLPAAFEVSK